jgi:hypothetical protein
MTKRDIPTLSCIDVTATGEDIFTMDHTGLTRTKFTLFSWLEAWVSGVDINRETFEFKEGSLTNACTGQQMSVEHRGQAKGVLVKPFGVT